MTTPRTILTTKLTRWKVMVMMIGTKMTTTTMMIMTINTPQEFDVSTDHIEGSDFTTHVM